MGATSDEFWELATSITSAQDEATIRYEFREVLKELGFGAAYFLSPVVSDPRVGRQLYSFGFPEEWGREYGDRLGMMDPFPKAALKHGGVFRWSQVGKILRLQPRNLRYLKALEGFGIYDGIGFPCYGPGARRSFLGVGLPDSEESFSTERVLKVQVAGQLAFQRQAQINRLVDLANPRLSQREHDVLQLIAKGKSNSVIAQVLSISRSTVGVYVARLFEKLDVSDRTSASVRALSLGLIPSFVVYDAGLK